MSSGTTSWLLKLAIVLAVLAVVREVSIRRHIGDLDDWPRVEAPESPA